ncbi:ATP-binding protein [Nonomuraea salmonea]|uniref:ATP-binding protein n=1 Tax=Nonomuraea salmonea TaxID=46181 RepID=UPI00361CDE56
MVLLPYAPSSVAVARQRLSTDLQDSGVFTAAIDDAVLVVSELLSNALRHAHPLPSGMVRVAWLRSDDHIEVAVSDGGAATEPRAGRPTLSSLGGRGLGIVEYVAESWGGAARRRHDDRVGDSARAKQKCERAGRGPQRGRLASTARSLTAHAVETSR